MDRKRRMALAGFLLSLVTTVATGFDRIESGKARQGLLLLGGAGVGVSVFFLRRRRGRGLDGAETAAEAAVGAATAKAAMPAEPGLADAPPTPADRAPGLRVEGDPGPTAR